MLLFSWFTLDKSLLISPSLSFSLANGVKILTSLSALRFTDENAVQEQGRINMVVRAMAASASFLDKQDVILSGCQSSSCQLSEALNSDAEVLGSNEGGGGKMREIICVEREGEWWGEKCLNFIDHFFPISEISEEWNRFACRF